MEEINLRYKQLLQAYSRLAYITTKFTQLANKENQETLLTNEENELFVYRDAVIQRFEFCYDLTWKFFKLILKEKFSIEATSPRKVFQECYQQNILTHQETESLLEMIDARNQATHVYDEAAADAISKKIVLYYIILADLVKKHKP